MPNLKTGELKNKLGPEKPRLLINTTYLTYPYLTCPFASLMSLKLYLEYSREFKIGLVWS